MPDAHARLSPSSAERWINCPGSIALSEECCPGDSDSDYTKEGTVAHSLCELKLNKFIGGITKSAYTKEYNKIKKSEYYSGEMEEATEFYLEQVTEIYNGAGDDAELMIEQHFTLDEYVLESFGTSDAVVISEGTIEVIDFKFGKGVKVSAKDNPQLRLYGLGASSLFGDIYDFDTVRLTIIQPRLDWVSTDEIKLDDLKAWATEVVVPQAKKAMDNIDELACGDWCRWCPAKTLCRKRAEANLELAKLDFKKPPLLSMEELGEVLSKADELKKWVTEVADYALKQALAGEEIEGWKIVEGRSNRTIKDVDAAVSKLKEAGFDEAILYKPRELYGITQLEKNCGKKKLTEVLGGLIVKPEGKPKLAPESDSRQAISSVAEAAKDFK